MRYLIQSLDSGKFVSADPSGWNPVVLVRDLSQALDFGTVDDLEHAQQIATDHLDPGSYRIVQLDDRP